MHNKNNSITFVKGLLAGLAFGTVAGYVGYKERRKLKFRMWMLKVKSEIYHELKKINKPTQADFEEVVDNVLEKYENLKDISQEQLEKIGDRLKTKWRDIKKKFAEESKKWADEEDEDDEDEE